jgi:outer membrane immunogenic protein
MKKLVLATAFVALSGVSAQAADVVTEAMHDWTGLYAGLNVGFGFGGDDRVGVNPTYGTVGKLEVSGIFGGAQLGYNAQMDQLVLGVEGDIQISDVNDSFSSGPVVAIAVVPRWRGSSDINYFGTLRARAGIAVDNALIYATGGLAFADVDYSVICTGCGPAVSLKDNYGTWGVALGGGVEYAFDDNWSGKVEYMFIGLGHKNITDGAQTTIATPSFHTVRVGINYKF